MTNREQLSFNYDETKPELELPKSDSKNAIEKPVSIETDDECQYCGALYESEHSCRYCASNPAKRAYIREKNK